MYINNYDTLLLDFFDEFKNKKFTLSNLNENISNINKSKFFTKILSLTKKESFKKKLNDITVNILLIYICLLTTYINNVNIKDLLLKKYSSGLVGEITDLIEEIKYIDIILKEESQEKKLDLYKSDLKLKNAFIFLDNIDISYIDQFLNIKNKDYIINLINTVIFKKVYQKKYRKEIFEIIEYSEEEKEIKIIVPKLNIIDYFSIESILNSTEVRKGLTQEIFDFFIEKEKLEKKNLTYNEKIKLLLKNKIVIPIINDFLRYNKITEKYEKKDNSKDKSKNRNINFRKEPTKIRYIVSQIEKVKDLYSKKNVNNPNLFKETMKFFYKPLLEKKAIVYNEIEEINILNKLKLQGKTAIDSNEFYHDLVNIRKSSYVNFKDFQKDGIRFIPNFPLSAVRYAQIEHINSSKNKNYIDYRTLNTIMMINGIIITNKKINKLNLNKLNDIRNFSKNGNLIVNKLLLNKINKSKNEDIYWIFDMDKDLLNQKTYEIELKNKEGMNKILMSNIYDNYVEIIYNKIKEKIKKLSDIDFYFIDKFFSYYKKKYIDLSNTKYLGLLINDIYEKIPITKNIIDTSEDKLYGINENVIKLPEIKEAKIIDNSTIIEYESKDELIDFDDDNTICQHNIDWINITKNRNDTNEYTQNLVSFVKKYAVLNKNSEYYCKSCKQLLDIKNYLSNPYEGGETGIDIIISSFQLLNTNPNYKKYNSAIKNIEKIIEKIADITNLTYFIGNDQIHTYRRHEIIRKTIDIINIHNDTLRNKINRKERQNKANKFYGVNSDLSTYFIFPLSNDIFKFSSNEVDKFKKIKINNIIAYVVLFMILEINLTQINLFEFDKHCNLFLYEKFADKTFNNLFLRTNNSNNVFPLKKYELLKFVIYYFACMISKYDIWFFSFQDDKKSFNILKFSFIHTMIDLINSLMEQFIKKEKNYMYEIVGSKISNKIKYLSEGNSVLKNLREREKKKISFNKTTNKLLFIKSKIERIKIDDNKKFFEDEIFKNKTNLSTIYTMNKFKLKNNKYEILGKELKNMYDNFILDNIRKLSEIYDDNGVIRTNKIVLTNKDINYKKKLKMMNIIESRQVKIGKIKENKIKKIIHKSKEKNIQIENDLDTDNLSDLLKIFGTNIDEEITLNKIKYNLYKSKIQINFNFLGNNLDQSLTYMFDSKYLEINNDYKNLGKVISINNKKSKVLMYFGFYNLNYLGYKENNRNFVDMKDSNLYCSYIPSIREVFKNIGFNKKYFFLKNKTELKQKISEGIFNYKQFIKDIISALYKIRYRSNDEPNNIIKYYQKKIKTINFSSSRGIIFKNYNDYLINQKNILKDKVIKESKLNRMANITYYSVTLKNLVNYLCYNLINLINSNDSKFTKVNICYFIISYSVYNYNLYIRSSSDFDMKRFEYILESNFIKSYNENLLYTKEELENRTQQEKDTILEQEIDDDERLDALDANQSDDDEEVLFESD